MTPTIAELRKKLELFGHKVINKPLSGESLRFKIEDPRIVGHTCRVEFNGESRETQRYVLYTDKGVMLLPIRAAELVQHAAAICPNEDLSSKVFILSKDGFGRNTRYLCSVSSSVDPNYIAPAKPTVPNPPAIRYVKLPPALPFVPDLYPVENVSHPAAKAVCKCDIKDLLSNGHTKGCPEKKR